MGFVVALIVAALTAVAVVRVLGIPLGWWRALLAGGAGTAAAGLTAAALSESGHGVQVLLSMIGAALAGGLFSAALMELIAPARYRRSFARSAIEAAALVRDARRVVRVIRSFARRGLTARSQPAGSRLGRALNLALSDCGGAFVKLGQLLSARPDIVPPDIAQQLEGLRDDVPPMRREDLERVLAEEFGAPPSSVFTDFDSTPIAAASIAQVHRAVTPAGDEVAVKVQRLDVAGQIQRDLSIMHRLARRLERRHEWARELQLVTLTQGLANALNEELDFRIEAHNADTVRAALASNPSIDVPEIHHPLSTRRVLVSTWSDGVSVSRRAPGSGSDTRSAELLIEAFLHPLLTSGTFHADPHPGNVLVLPTGTVVLLDFGSTGYLDQRQRAALGSLLSALSRQDSPALRRSLLAVAPPRRAINNDELERALDALLLRHTTGQALDGRGVIADLMALLRDFGLSVEPHIAGAFRAVLTLEGTLHLLDPTFDVLASARETARRLVPAPHMASQLGVEGLVTALRPALAHLAGLTRTPSPLPFDPSPADDTRTRSNVTPAIIADVQLTAVGLALLAMGLVGLAVAADLEGYRLWAVASALALGAVLTLRALVASLRISASARSTEVRGASGT